MKSRAAIDVGLGQPLIVDEIEIPDPGPGNVIVKLFSSGVCHSQLHERNDTAMQRPRLLGHEGTGVVTHVGQGVSHLREGDHAIVTWVSRRPMPGVPDQTVTPATYREEPLHGRNAFTWAQDVSLNAEFVVPIPDDAPTDVTSIVGCAVLTGAGAVMHTANVRPGDSVAVFGVGGVGLSAVRMAALLEADPIIAVDLNEDKLGFAQQFGATHGVNASESDPVEAILDLTGGVDYAFDAIGVRATMEQVLPVTRAGGRGADNHGGMAVLVGLPQTEITLDASLFVWGQRILRGSLGPTYPERDFEMYLRLHREGKFPLDQLVTDRYGLDQINEACDDLASGKILGRGILEY